jgi:hypothetical protein
MLDAILVAINNVPERKLQFNRDFLLNETLLHYFESEDVFKFKIGLISKEDVYRYSSLLCYWLLLCVDQDIEEYEEDEVHGLYFTKLTKESVLSGLSKLSKVELSVLVDKCLVVDGNICTLLGTISKYVRVSVQEHAKKWKLLSEIENSSQEIGHSVVMLPVHLQILKEIKPSTTCSEYGLVVEDKDRINGSDTVFTYYAANVLELMFENGLSSDKVRERNQAIECLDSIVLDNDVIKRLYKLYETRHETLDTRLRILKFKNDPATTLFWEHFGNRLEQHINNRNLASTDSVSNTTIPLWYNVIKYIASLGVRFIKAHSNLETIDSVMRSDAYNQAYKLSINRYYTTEHSNLHILVPFIKSAKVLRVRYVDTDMVSSRIEESGLNKTQTNRVSLLMVELVGVKPIEIVLEEKTYLLDFKYMLIEDLFNACYKDASLLQKISKKIPIFYLAWRSEMVFKIDWEELNKEVSTAPKVSKIQTFMQYLHLLNDAVATYQRVGNISLKKLFTDILHVLGIKDSLDAHKLDNNLRGHFIEKLHKLLEASVGARQSTVLTNVCIGIREVIQYLKRSEKELIGWDDWLNRRSPERIGQYIENVNQPMVR